VGKPKASAVEVRGLTGPFGNSTKQDEGGGLIASWRPELNDREG
jgi:hypothetical protein